MHVVQALGWIQSGEIYYRGSYESSIKEPQFLAITLFPWRLYCIQSMM